MKLTHFWSESRQFVLFTIIIYIWFFRECFFFLCAYTLLTTNKVNFCIAVRELLIMDFAECAKEVKKFSEKKNAYPWMLP